MSFPESHQCSSVDDDDDWSLFQQALDMRKYGC